MSVVELENRITKKYTGTLQIILTNNNNNNKTLQIIILLLMFQ